MNIHATPRPAQRTNPVVAFFVSRWRGYCPLDRLFWRDMILVGTAISLASTFAALMLLGFKAPTPLAIAVHFAPVPYNIFLFISVWRTADRVGPAAAPAARMGATLWLILATLV